MAWHPPTGCPARGRLGRRHRTNVRALNGRGAGRWPAGSWRDGHGESGTPTGGELAAFCRPVMTAPAVVRRDGTVLADAWLPGMVRLGELESHLGEGVIEDLVAQGGG
jgi:hypothetical protein